MHARLSHVSLMAVVALAFVLQWSLVDAQPTPAEPAPAPASDREKARKLTDEAIAAERAKQYHVAIAFYQHAYQLVPHPILIFNIGQIYMLTGNSREAEKYFRRYLAHDPDGPGASVAHKFLDSIPAADPSPPSAASPSEPVSLTTSANKAEAVPPAAAPTRKHEPSTASGSRVPANDLNEQRSQQIASTPRSSVSSKDEHLRTPGKAYAQKKGLRGIVTQRMGFALMGTGVALGVIALSAFSDDKTGIVLMTAAAAATAGGFVMYAYGESQLRAAKAIAWSPVVGADFAGVALAGSLP